MLYANIEEPRVKDHSHPLCRCHVVIVMDTGDAICDNLGDLDFPRVLTAVEVNLLGLLAKKNNKKIKNK